MNKVAVFCNYKTIDAEDIYEFLQNGKNVIKLVKLLTTFKLLN